MVRLVFRPYTQIWRSICTSESLRASTRVSPGFTLFRHSSPSFGYQHICSYSNLSSGDSWSVDSARSQKQTFLPQLTYISIHFHYAFEFNTPILAHMLDSLVRVSRRDKSLHFVKSPEQQECKHTWTSKVINTASCLYKSPTHKHPQI